MKIIKKSKIKPTTCEYCNSVFQAKYRDLKQHPLKTALEVNCPVCKNYNYVHFEEEKDNG